MDENRLSKCVTESLMPLIGQQLSSVFYWCLKHEAKVQDTFDPEFYFGGEVELRFASSNSLFLTWDEKAGWPDHFSICTRTQTCFLPDTLQPFDASNSPHWQDHIGMKLQGCTVLGRNATPHVVVFRFAKGAVCVADGYQKRMCDGDDILVRAERDAIPLLADAQTLWESRNHAGQKC